MKSNEAFFCWLIEAPDQRYLATRKLGSLHEFVWSTDHNAALRFYTETQADMVMMAVRQLGRDVAYDDLFGFERSLGNAKAVEHAWIPDAGGTA